jgi:hypothetical protein
LSSNYERLKAEGLIFKDCPDPHRQVLNDLTDDEMEVILSVKERLAEADASVGAHAVPPFTNCIGF